jgi:hypothetical protein
MYFHDDDHQVWRRHPHFLKKSFGAWRCTEMQADAGKCIREESGFVGPFVGMEIPQKA